MTRLSIERPAAGLGRALARLSAAAAAAGAVALVAGLAAGRAAAVLAALQGSWLFLAGLSAGAVAFAAAVRVSGGKWADPVLPAAYACTGFSWPAMALLGVLAPGRGTAAILPLLVSLPIVGAGARFLSAAHGARADPSRVVGTGIGYLVAFVPGMSMWAFWLAAGPAGRTPAIVPITYVVGAFLSGVAWVSAVAALRDAGGSDVRHDLGKLLFGLAALWSYLVWALVLPTWYGNEPGDAAYLLARSSGAYRPVTVVLLLAVSVVPLVLLLPERAKRGRAPLAAAALSILLGSWTAPHLMALPPLRVPGEPWGLLAGAAVGVGMAGVFLLSVGARLGESRPPPVSGRISPPARTM